MSSLPVGASRSRKGERVAAQILDAATAVLAREGFGGATLGRIAAEAGVDKKMLSYYFSGREGLLTEVVRRLGAQLMANLRATAAELEPGPLIDVGIDQLWRGSIEEPELVRAYLALATNSRESPEVRGALAALKSDFEALFAERLDLLAAGGHHLGVDRAGYLTLIVAIWRGLAFDWAEDGETPALSHAIEQFKAVAVAPFERAGE